MPRSLFSLPQELNNLHIFSKNSKSPVVFAQIHIVAFESLDEALKVGMALELLQLEGAL